MNPWQIAIIGLLAFGIGPLATAQSLVEDGSSRYSTHCADCHESDGRGADYRNSGSDIPDFSSKAWMKTKSPTELRLSILLGKGDEMPPFAEELSKSEANALVRYIQTFAGIEPNRSNTLTRMVSRDRQQADREWNRLRTEWHRLFNSLGSGTDLRESLDEVR